MKIYYINLIGEIVASSFAELQKNLGSITLADLEATLNEYVQIGGDINHHLTITVLGSLDLSPADLKRLRDLCLEGETKQLQAKQTNVARRYFDVVQYLEDKIKATT